MDIGGGVSRRRLLAMGAAAGIGLFAAPIVEAAPLIQPRLLRFENLNTGETLQTIYRVKAGYVRAGLREINHHLRDHHVNEVYPIDPRLLDLLYALRLKLGAEKPFHIISGYRSPETNAMLAYQKDGVAANSLHMYGQAVDIRVPGRSLKLVRNAAVTLQAGGVGYYPRTNFVHVDVGRVRSW
ncbi:MAG: DUF882 domain-containing protein [Alphaproteobacteria bacterium]|nr:DUF882 domain-containing protein [Alphaproteobacteria bacterium]